jgi:tetratricopeptide (TPR) repeat protein
MRYRRAHALGAAQTGDLAGAQREIDKLLRFKEQLLQAKDNYWANQVEVQRLGASAVLAYAQGDKESAIKLARAAADLDATMDKHPATPAEVLPARELLADLLLQSGDPGAALKQYEESLRSEPNRFRSLLGKARAAEQSGDMAMAKTAYQKLLALSSQADADTPELAEAKAFLSKNI